MTRVVPSPPDSAFTVFAPDIEAEVVRGSDLASIVADAVGSHPLGPLRTGDIVAITSKVVSKTEGRSFPAAERAELIVHESERTVARRGDLRIVRTRGGLTIAAAGVDTSNVDRDTVLALPADPDASADRLRADLYRLTGLWLGVVVTDTAGRAWRVGQTDHAIGAAGIAVALDYSGTVDPYGNPLQVTLTAVADEIAAAADLIKGKLSGRPIAVLRGLGHLLTAGTTGAGTLVRPEPQDLFSYGSTEAVLARVLAVLGRPADYEDLLDLPAEERAALILDRTGLTGATAELVSRLLQPHAPPGDSSGAG